MTSVIAVVNLERFQHYKDRDPPWVKLYRDILSAESWVLGTDTSRLLQVAIILLAARYNNRIPLQWMLIRKVASLDCTEAQFQSALSHLVAQNFVEIQSVTETGEAVVQDASSVLALARSRETEAEQRQSRAEADTRAAKPPSSDDGGFAQFRSLYPKRSGDQRWQAARKAFGARLREGSTLEQVLDGTRRYAAWCDATGKVGTEHVKQAATFVGTERCYLETFDLPAKPNGRGPGPGLKPIAEIDRQIAADRERIAREGIT